MKGCLLINGFYSSEKFDILYQHIITAFDRLGVTVDIITNDKAYSLVSSPVMYSFVLFWDKDIYLAQQLENAGYTLFNGSRGIALADDKVLTYNALYSHIDMPLTIPVPFAYSYSGYTNTEWIDQYIEILGLPVVIKECYGSFGYNVHLAHTRQECKDIVSHIGTRPMLFSRYIYSSHGKDIRLHVVGNEVVASVMRCNDTDFRANATLGGTMLPYTPTKQLIDMAVTACQHLTLDFAGVDILLDGDTPLLCEVNSNAHFVNLYNTTGVNVADYIAQHIVNTTSQKK